MTSRTLLAAAGALLLSLSSPDVRAAGWQEVHESANDVRVIVDPSGHATVEHHVRLRVVAGHFKTFELTGIDLHAETLKTSALVPEKGPEIPATIELNPKQPGTARLLLEDVPRGVGRGVYVADVRYDVDLVAAKMLTRDGGMWRLAWTSPPAVEGHDGARVVFELPSAPTEPRLASPEQSVTTLPTLRRSADKDEIELVRAHVPRGESVTWAVRVDPKAFPGVVSPELRPPPSVAAARDGSDGARAAWGVAVLAAAAVACAVALRRKRAATRAACVARGAVARPLVPLGDAVASVLYGGLVAGALASLLFWEPAAGGALVAAAMAVSAHRAPWLPEGPRGPGVWRTIADAEVFVQTPREGSTSDRLDIGTRQGRIVFLVLALAFAAVAFALRLRVAGATVAIPLCGAALVPLFVTGTRAQLPWAPLELASRVLRPARDALGRMSDLAHVEVRTIARFRGAPDASTDPRAVDEVRLFARPVDATPGLTAIELATVVPRDGAPSAALLEVLVRFEDGSPAAARIAHVARGVPIVPGRSPHERVLSLRPVAPTSLAAASLVARLLGALEERRDLSSGPWEGRERRLPPPRPSKTRRERPPALRAEVALAGG